MGSQRVGHNRATEHTGKLHYSGFFIYLFFYYKQEKPNLNKFKGEKKQPSNSKDNWTSENTSSTDFSHQTRNSWRIFTKVRNLKLFVSKIPKEIIF